MAGSATQTAVRAFFSSERWSWVTSSHIKSPDLQQRQQLRDNKKKDLKPAELVHTAFTNLMTTPPTRPHNALNQQLPTKHVETCRKKTYSSSTVLVLRTCIVSAQPSQRASTPAAGSVRKSSTATPPAPPSLPAGW